MNQQQRQICRSPEVIDLIQSFIHTMNNKGLRRSIIEKTIRLCEKNKTHKWLGSWIVELGAVEAPRPSQTQQQRLDRLLRPEIEEEKKLLTLRMIQQVQQIQQPDVQTQITGMSRRAQREHMKLVNLSLNQFVKQNMAEFSEKKCLFTVMIVYSGNLVHYVAFVYDPKTRTLISFDSGVELYEHGRKTILPAVRKAFRDAGLILTRGINRQHDLGHCYGYNFCGKEWGVQYNGLHQHSLPADSFCQTWTIFFLKRYIEKRDEQDLSFVRSWCRVHPGHRESIIIRDFLLPLIAESEEARRVYLREIGGQKSYHEVVDILRTYLEKCSMGINKPDVVCPRQRHAAAPA
ncbi:hypothetical protein EBZ80_03525 [bacterium]|nr:hypothetical protein [bacterium]